MVRARSREAGRKTRPRPRVENLRRHRAAAGAFLRPRGRPRLDRQKYLFDQSGDGIVVFPGRDPDIARAGTGFPAAGSMRDLYALHRCLPHAGDCAGRLSDRRAALHSLLHHRVAWFGAGGNARRDRPAHLWLRYLPGCLSVESPGARGATSLLSSPAISRRRWKIWPG